MSIFLQIINTLKLGGAMVYPLSLLCIIALAIIIDKIFLYQKFTKLPAVFYAMIEDKNFSSSAFEAELTRLGDKNFYRQFFAVILKNKTAPKNLLEMSAEIEAKKIEKNLNAGMWILETIITAAPLLGLLGTIVGMMSSFKIIGSDGVLNPSGVTAGVAESLIATGIGLAIAILALFAFNYFSKRSEELLDELETLGSALICHYENKTNS